MPISRARTDGPLWRGVQRAVAAARPAQAPPRQSAPGWAAPADMSAPGSIATWLLRCGIRGSKVLHLGEQWNIAVRAAILGELRLRERIVESEESLYVDQDPTGCEWFDQAAAAMVERSYTEHEWLRRGAVKARDIADAIAVGERWTRRPTPLGQTLHGYRDWASSRYWPEGRRFAEVLVYPHRGSPAEAVVAVLAHALNVVLPDSSVDGERPITPGIPAIWEMLERGTSARCGRAEGVVTLGLVIMRDANAMALGGRLQMGPMQI